MNKRHLRLLLEYDGTEYEGWQSQRSGNTIQDLIERAVCEITGSHARLTAASRTDAGVHALGQVAVFSTDSGLAADVIMRALNAKLPNDIRVLSAEETAAEFHPRFDSTGKRYTYLIGTGRYESVFLRRYVCHQYTLPEADVMRKAASMLLGRHDFSSFRASGCSAKTAVRTIHSIEVARLDHIDFLTFSFRGDFISISVEADSFLRHMVRNIAGTLIEIGIGKMKADRIGQILDARDRTLAGPTAEARGLFLEKVFY
jgi:tRNA pseudouridine38-40 synthase